MSNPYHLPKGTPQGGEFTHGPDSAKAKTTEARHYTLPEPVPGGADLYKRLSQRAMMQDKGKAHYEEIQHMYNIEDDHIIDHVYFHQNFKK